jgi:NAD(P)-dependent dehydrogenase (short-subunit alcohol dehydrogenase family)
MTSRVALVTGASAGIGRASAIAFAQAGYRVIVSDVNEQGGEETASMITSSHGKEKAGFYKADVSQEEEVVSLMQHIKDTYGRLDAAFNNAGIEGKLSGIAECSVENFDRTLAVNLRGTFLCCKYEIPLMLENSEPSPSPHNGEEGKVGLKGSIVNCSSVAGKIGHPLLPAYAASKHGVLGLTKSLAIEMAGRGIRVNAICPGVIQTAMIDHIRHTVNVEEMIEARQPMKRPGRPEEVASAAVWLCSDTASFVTGVGFDVDGGWLAS